MSHAALIRSIDDLIAHAVSREHIAVPDAMRGHANTNRELDQAPERSGRHDLAFLVKLA